MQFTSGGIGYRNGCVYGTGSTLGYMPIVLPKGAKLIHVKVHIYDGSTGSYSVALRRRSRSNNVYTNVSLLRIYGGAQTDVLAELDIAPSTPEIVGAGESYSVEFSNISAGNDFCAVEVTYDLPIQ